MDSRYPAPFARDCFSDQVKIDRWTDITKSMAKFQARRHPASKETLLHLNMLCPPDARAVATREQTTGHDVVAFLQLLTEQLSQDDPSKSFIHFGLTSSDLVETAHFWALCDHITHLVDVTMLPLGSTVYDCIERLEGQLAVGRTHGQVAEVTSWSHRLNVWYNVLVEIRGDMIETAQSLRVVKTPGPTGQSTLWEHSAPGKFGRFIPSTQVIPRDYQLRWAALYLRLACHIENLATWLRAGAAAGVAEVAEGYPKGRVGSSAMAHKRNPVRLERLCGAARVVRGHFASIAENCALDMDRDISNSIVERTSAPDMAAMVEWMVDELYIVFNTLEWDTTAMSRNLMEASAYAYMNLYQAAIQKFAIVGPIEAQRLLRDIGWYPGLLMPVLVRNLVGRLTGSEQQAKDCGYWIDANKKKIEETF